MMTGMTGFGDPFLRSGRHPGFPSALPAPGYVGQHHMLHPHNRQVAPRDMFGSMFGDMFANMNSMMANMHRNFVSVANNIDYMY